MARDFDGSTQKITMGDPSVLNVTTGNFTFSAWIDLDAAPGTYSGGVLSRGDNNTNVTRVMALEITTGGLPRFELYDGAFNPFVTSSGSSLAGAGWKHIACCRDSGTLRLYVSGSADGTTADTTSDLSNSGLIWAIGKRMDSNFGDWINGRIAECAVWMGVALNASEMAALANGFSPRFVRPASLEGYWPLIGRSDPEVELINGNTGTLSNSPAQASHPRVIYPRRRQAFSVAAAAPASAVGHYYRNHLMARRRSG